MSALSALRVQLPNEVDDSMSVQVGQGWTWVVGVSHWQLINVNIDRSGRMKSFLWFMPISYAHVLVGRSLLMSSWKKNNTVETTYQQRTIMKFWTSSHATSQLRNTLVGSQRRKSKALTTYQAIDMCVVCRLGSIRACLHCPCHWQIKAITLRHQKHLPLLNDHSILEHSTLEIFQIQTLQSILGQDLGYKMSAVFQILCVVMV
jgi:hypothetical protein